MYTSRCTTRIYFRAPFFLIYINDLATDLKSNVKLFANDTSFFSVVSDLLETANILNEDLGKNWRWAEQWKMAFNTDPTKQAQEVAFSKKLWESFHPNLYFNKFVVEKVQTQKHVGLKLDKKLSFKEHVKDKFAKVNMGIGILKKIEWVLTTPFINYSLQILYTTSLRLCWHLWPTK